MMGCEFDRFAKGLSAWMTRSSELPDIVSSARLLGHETAAVQSDVAGHGTASRVSRGTVGRREAANL